MGDDTITVTVQELAEFMAELGVTPGSTLLVHASLGGTGLAPAVVRRALQEVLGSAGTLVVPAFTPENSDTSDAYHKRTAHMSPEEREADRAAMKPYDPRRTPCPTMGVLAEHVRRTPGAYRSAHPQTSFAAVGRRAARLMDGHDPHCHLGERSPLAKLYSESAHVLLLRTGFGECSAFHLAEYRAWPEPPLRTYRCVMGRTPGNWIAYQDVVLDDSDFAAIGSRMPEHLITRRVLHGRTVSLLALRDAVDHACRDMAEHRPRMS
ncbi:aminoglycoside N(3)-acetyltransferase [Streptomyces sp. NPDC002577]